MKAGELGEAVPLGEAREIERLDLMDLGVLIGLLDTLSI